MFQGNLIEKCKNNDRKAQLQLYNKYCDGMFYVAYRFMKSVEDAEDAMQEAFIKAFKKLHQYNGEVTFGSWLKKIVINQCLDQLKYDKKMVFAQDESVVDLVEEDDSIGYLDSEDVLKEEIMTAIESLPEKYRIVVLLFMVEGFDHQEIAEVLQITETASRTKLLRGKRKLQVLLKHYSNGIA